MNTTHVQRPVDAAPADHRRRHGDLDADLVAVLAVLAILVMTALCFLGRGALPL